MKVLTGLLLATACYGQVPKINFVTNAGYFAGNTIATNSFVSIYGTNLATSTVAATTSPLPRTLGGVDVSLCGPRGFEGGCLGMRIAFVSPGQINFLLEYGAQFPNGAAVVVRSNGRSDADYAAGNREYPVRVIQNAVTPGVFAAGFDCLVELPVRCGLSGVKSHDSHVMRPMITDLEYKPISSENIARPGESYVIWLTGLGYPNIAGDLRSRVNLEMAYKFKLNGTGPIGSLPVTLIYAGPAPGFQGLYQINFSLPVGSAKNGGACGFSRDGNLELTSSTSILNMPFPIRAQPQSAACQ